MLIPITAGILYLIFLMRRAWVKQKPITDPQQKAITEAINMAMNQPPSIAAQAEQLLACLPKEMRQHVFDRVNQIY